MRATPATNHSIHHALSNLPPFCPLPPLLWGWRWLVRSWSDPSVVCLLLQVLLVVFHLILDYSLRSLNAQLKWVLVDLPFNTSLQCDNNGNSGRQYGLVREMCRALYWVWEFPYWILTTTLWGACELPLIWQMKKLRLREGLWLGWDNRIHTQQGWDSKVGRSDSQDSAPSSVSTLECLCNHQISHLFDSLWESLL